MTSDGYTHAHAHTHTQKPPRADVQTSCPYHFTTRVTMNVLFQNDDVLDLAIEKINALLESFLGINDAELGMVTHLSHLSPPSPCAGLPETYPSFPVSDPFLPDVPGFQVPLTVSFHRNFGLPIGHFPSIFILTTAPMFSVSSLL